MNSFLKKNINRALNVTFRVVTNKCKRAKCATGISRLFYGLKNKVVYDDRFDMYWQQSKGVYLQLSKYPIYDFSYTQYENRFNTIFGRKYDLKAGDTVIDIGAGIGAELPFYIRKIGKAGAICAIEASPDSFEKLQVLCAHNPMGPKVSLHNIAISDKSGSVWMEETDLYRANQINTKKQGIEVTAITLNQFVKEQNIEKVNLLKMNIEGAELQVIKGMDEIVGKVENFAISCHDFLFEEKTEIKETVKHYFENNGFVVEEIATGNKYVDSWIYGKRIR